MYIYHVSLLRRHSIDHLHSGLAWLAWTPGCEGDIATTFGNSVISWKFTESNMFKGTENEIRNSGHRKQDENKRCLVCFCFFWQSLISREKHWRWQDAVKKSMGVEAHLKWFRASLQRRGQPSARSSRTLQSSWGSWWSQTIATNIHFHHVCLPGPEVLVLGWWKRWWIPLLREGEELQSVAWDRWQLSCLAHFWAYGPMIIARYFVAMICHATLLPYIYHILLLYLKYYLNILSSFKSCQSHTRCPTWSQNWYPFSCAVLGVPGTHQSHGTWVHRFTNYRRS